MREVDEMIFFFTCTFELPFISATFFWENNRSFHCRWTNVGGGFFFCSFVPFVPFVDIMELRFCNKRAKKNPSSVHWKDLLSPLGFKSSILLLYKLWHNLLLKSRDFKGFFFSLITLWKKASLSLSLFLLFFFSSVCQNP